MKNVQKIANQIFISEDIKTENLISILKSKELLETLERQIKNKVSRIEYLKTVKELKEELNKIQ